jgi:hypothetical protein
VVTIGEFWGGWAETIFVKTNATTRQVQLSSFIFTYILLVNIINKKPGSSKYLLFFTRLGGSDHVSDLTKIGDR